MKLFHISDLHIGRFLHKYNLGECQKEVLHRIVELAEKEQPDVVMIAGDIFDKSVPSGEAYTIFDSFLQELTEALPGLTVLIIAGNHDSAERLQYAGSFLEKHRIFISVLPPGTPDEHLKKIVLSDEYGEVDFYLLPFTKPSYVRKLFAEEPPLTYTEAVARILERENPDPDRRKVILSHQFYASGDWTPKTCESEQTAVAGGLDSVDVDLLADFEYAALGHLHGSQKVKYPQVRYCGTPFPYSVSEEHQKKSVVQIVLGPKGQPAEISFLPIEASRTVRSIRDRLEEVLQAAQTEVDSGKVQDYVSIVLTDENDGLLTDAREKLEERYANILEIRVDNQRTRGKFEESTQAQEDWTVSQAFAHFFEDMNHRPLNEAESAVMEQLWEKWGLSDEAD